MKRRYVTDYDTLYIDFGFLIILPAILHIEGIDWKQDEFEWGGISYPQDSPYFPWGKHFHATKEKYKYAQALPRIFSQYQNQDWDVYYIDGDGLSLYRMELMHERTVEWDNYDLSSLISFFLKDTEQWVILLLKQQDTFSDIIRCEKKRIMHHIDNCLIELSRRA